jgi:hypothetical protein
MTFYKVSAKFEVKTQAWIFWDTEFEYTEIDRWVKAEGWDNIEKHMDSEFLAYDKDWESCEVNNIILDLPANYHKYWQDDIETLAEAIRPHVIVKEHDLYSINGILRIDFDIENYHAFTGKLESIEQDITLEQIGEDIALKHNGYTPLFSQDNMGRFNYCEVPKNKEQKTMSDNMSNTQALIEQLNSMKTRQNSLNKDAGVLFLDIKTQELYKPDFKSFDKFAAATQWNKGTVHALVKIVGIPQLRDALETLGISKADRIAKGNFDDEAMAELINYAMDHSYASVKEEIAKKKEEVSDNGKDDSPKEETLEDLLAKQTKLLQEKKFHEERAIELAEELGEIAGKVAELSK